MRSSRHRLLPTLTILLSLGFLVTSLASFGVSLSSLRDQISTDELPITSDNVYSEVQRDLLYPILISSVMAQDTFLRDWVLSGESDPEEIEQYLSEIKARYDTVTAFFVSDETLTYYYADGILKTVSPNAERDIWYFRVRDMAQDYEINIDRDMANRDAMTIFVNYRVLDYQGNFVGATGVGLTVDAVGSLIGSLQSHYHRDVFFIDGDGNVTMAAPESRVPSNVFQSETHAGLTRAFGIAPETAFAYRRGSHRIHANVRYIPELRWYLVVEQDERTATSGITRTLMINLALCAVITTIVLGLVRRTTKAYQERIETLSGIVPICSYCKKIRDDQGYWNQVEAYISEHTEAEFSHGICPDCLAEHFPEMAEDAPAE